MNRQTHIETPGKTLPATAVCVRNDVHERTSKELAYLLHKIYQFGPEQYM